MHRFPFPLRVTVLFVALTLCNVALLKAARVLLPLITTWIDQEQTADLVLYLGCGLAGFAVLAYMVVSTVFDIRLRKAEFAIEQASWRASQGVR